MKYELIINGKFKVCKGQVFDRKTNVCLDGTEIAEKVIVFLRNRLDWLESMINEIDPIWGDISKIEELNHEYIKIIRALD